ncbi:MAG: ribonuclease D [Xanthomonadales bacterium]|nr:ribonuclease D [Xanthomonadales bacterium]
MSRRTIPMFKARPMQSKRELANPMIPEPPAQATTITTTAELVTFIDAVAHRAWVAIDTEFLREKTYYPKLCLVQIADTEICGVIDVLAIEDLSALVRLLVDAETIKVFHSAEQDLEVLLHTLGVMPAPLFDTQLAAPLVGLDDQMGYARMIAALLDVSLSKAHTRTDWSRRPLPAGAIDYAADDVRYLAVAYPRLVAALGARDRLGWVMDDTARMTDPARFAPAPETAWRRVKGWFHLPAGTQQILAELAAWRERVAVEADRPRRWILSDTALITLAEQAPTDDITLADTVELSDKMLARHTDELLAAISRGKAAPATVLDPDAGPPDNATKRLIKHGMQALEQAAQAAELPAATLGSRAEIARLVAGRRDTRLLTGWRAEIAGRDVLAAIEAHQGASS